MFVVRHCEAAPGEVDALRPLTDPGRSAARALALRLSQVEPAAVLSSPLLRARETAAAIAAASGLVVETDERLGPGMTAEDLRAVAGGRGDPVVVVGHNPDLADVVHRLTGQRPVFPPGGVVEIEVEVGP
jgi:phosphohistidine phosphatase